ncbi:MAG: phosphoribosylanthranilate isomerase [Methanobacteriaceae archaeon]|nr:phosphoribosylanthranilate isomerase [Methanobacteriaceae archaeon]
MTKIKICGIKRPEDINIVNKYKPDYIGFVFFKKSHRNISVTGAQYLNSFLDTHIQSVGVFVNEDYHKIIKLFKLGIIDIAQLHGNETEEYIKLLKKNAFEKVGKDLKIIKALKIIDDKEIFNWESSCVDYLLLDNGKGTGKTFDWTLIQENIEKPFFLAGGLNSGNVINAIKKINPFAVDVSSGTETNKIKDEEKIKKFINNVRNLSK